MTPRPFLLRLILPFALTIALIVTVCGVVIHFAGERTIRLQHLQNLANVATVVQESLWPGTENASVPPSSNLEKNLHNTARILNARVTLIAGDGHVLFDSAAEPATMQNHNDRPEVIEARAKGTGATVRHSVSVNEESSYVAALVHRDEPNGLVIRLSYPQRNWIELLTPTWVTVLGGAIAALLVIVLLGIILQRAWIGPVRELARAAERMTAGEWQLRVEAQGADDIRFFGSKLNRLAAEAQRQLSDLNHQRADLQALVDSLPDPILSIDDEQRVILLNQPAAQLLDLAPSQALGKNIATAVSDEPIIALFEEARSVVKTMGKPQLLAGAISTAQPLHRELRLNRDGQRHTFQAVATATAGGGALMVLRDVSTMASAVQMKTDFVANASHELRTPIAAIKIAFETLRDVLVDDPEQSERCIQIIDGHLKRLEEMLRDLLDLSRVENEELKPHVKRLYASELFNPLRSTLSPMSRQKLIELNLQVLPDESATFATDARLLNLVLKNLVENSIKFTTPGGSVTVRIEVREKDVKISVADTGIGIAPEHIDRVFERFYQVDAARSGSAGRGTGLGLAIVKHAVLALSGTVDVESKVGEGTTVTCVFPQREDDPESYSEEPYPT